MTSLFRTAQTGLLTAMISLASFSPLAAQDTAPAELSAGAPIEGESNVGQNYTLESHGDWEIRCLKATEGQADPCSMYQLLKDQDGREIAEVTLFYLDQGEAEAAMTITTPLETLLTEQLSFFVDETNGRRYPFSFCTAQGCIVRAGLKPEEVTQLKNGNVAQVGVVAARSADKPLLLNMSLTGFTAGYTKVTELNKEARAAAAQ